MKAEKKQFSNRMGAAVLLLALACVNGYAQENKSSNDGSSMVYSLISLNVLTLSSCRLMVTRTI